MRLFLAQGYGATTVEQITMAAGVSHVTFFRHFAIIAELIRARPTDEDRSPPSP